MFIIAGGVILGGLGLLLVLALLPWIIDGIRIVCFTSLWLFVYFFKVLADPLEQVKGFRRVLRYAFVCASAAVAVAVYALIIRR